MADKAIMKGIDDLKSMPEFQCGLWYSPYVKIYSIGGPNRIAEISTYPRAYKDTTPHVYTQDTPFIVSEGDLNDEVDGERVYRDSHDKMFRVGEEATHYAGDGLPSAFPLWIESEDLPVPEEGLKLHLEDIPGKKINLRGVHDRNLVKLDGKALVEARGRQIFFIEYQRVA